MKRFLLATALTLVFSAINLVPLQGQSVAGSKPLASKEATVIADEHHAVALEDIRPNVGTQVSPRRRVVAKAAAGKFPAIEQPMIAAITQSEATTAHKELFNEALYALPADCRNTLKNLYVRYEKQASRGLAGKSIMILDGTIKSTAELRALFIHESAHNWDLGCLKGTADAGKSTFSDGSEVIYNNDPSLGFYKISWLTGSVQRSTANPEDFVSGYASYDVFEDFAESFAYFVLHNDQFAARAETNDALAKKYAFIRDTLFNGTVPTLATSIEKLDGKVPWDITKLSYKWHPGEIIVQR